jgi:hypothetical protein
MSKIYNRNQFNILPKISFKSKFYYNFSKLKNKYSINSNPNEIIHPISNSKEKKPGTSINSKKPIYILPEIPIKKLSKTSSIKTNNNNNDDRNNFNGQNEDPINVIQNQRQIYYEKYENIALQFLENDEELKSMFNDLYGDKEINHKKILIEENLFKKEVFWTILEFYEKGNLDINNFIRKEIRKILKNKILDNSLAKSLKIVQFQYNEYINKIHNL